MKSDTTGSPLIGPSRQKFVVLKVDPSSFVQVLTKYGAGQFTKLRISISEGVSLSQGTMN